MSVRLYDEIAEWYAKSVEDSPVHAIAVPALCSLVGDAAGQRVLDLACGTGVIARELAGRGAQVTGVDLSGRLLEIARTQEQSAPQRIHFQTGDAQDLIDFEEGCFEGVACGLALMDIPDLEACLKSVSRVLAPGGWFVFTLIHPCFQTPDSRWTGQTGGTVKREVRGYFREGYWQSSNPFGVRGQVGTYHRTLSVYLNGLIGAGFVLERLLEPKAEGSVASRVPGYLEVPVVLAVRAIKGVCGDKQMDRVDG